LTILKQRISLSGITCTAEVKVDYDKDAIVVKVWIDGRSIEEAF